MQEEKGNGDGWWREQCKKREGSRDGWWRERCKKREGNGVERK